MNIERLRPECIKCLLDKYLEKYPENITDNQKLEYMQKILEMVAKAPKSYATPVIVSKMNEVHKQLFGIPIEDFTQVKWHFNEIMMECEEVLQKRLEEAEDPLRLAIQYALVGNYIDFGTIEYVDEAYLSQLLEEAGQRPVSEVNYELLKKELSTGKKMVFLTDNCGEIVMDKLLIQVIQRLFPKLEITVIVRGGDVLNDATIVDAQQIGLTEQFHVIGNGNNIAGTWLEELSQEAEQEIDSADVIIAKGQANYETLRFCRKNIYYLFLCKCQMFARNFGVPQFTGMLVREKG